MFENWSVARCMLSGGSIYDIYRDNNFVPSDDNPREISCDVIFGGKMYSGVRIEGVTLCTVLQVSNPVLSNHVCRLMTEWASGWDAIGVPREQFPSSIVTVMMGGSRFGNDIAHVRGMFDIGSGFIAVLTNSANFIRWLEEKAEEVLICR